MNVEICPHTRKQIESREETSKSRGLTEVYLIPATGSRRTGSSNSHAERVSVLRLGKGQYYSEFSEGSQHECSTEAEFESRVILNSGAQVYPFHISLYPRCWDNVVAVRCSPLAQFNR